MEVRLIGAKREHLDLGLWGCFKLRFFKEEPMRCFRCQTFGHHKDMSQLTTPSVVQFAAADTRPASASRNTRRDKAQQHVASTAKETIMRGIPNAQNV